MLQRFDGSDSFAQDVGDLAGGEPSGESQDENPALLLGQALGDIHLTRREAIWLVLADFGLDENMIIAEAFRMRLSCVQAHSLLLSSAENRKRKALRAYDDYRATAGGRS